MPAFKDLTGQKFGRLNIILYLGNGKYECLCDCGNYKKVNAQELRTGDTKSCGCLKKDLLNLKYSNLNCIKYNLSGEYGIGTFQDGSEFYFDLEDYEKIKDYKWKFTTRKYIICRNNNKTINLHRLIMNVEDSEILIDHINHNTFDNRKCNLRIADKVKNQRNRVVSKNNSSGVTGVCYHKFSDKWQAYIYCNGKYIELGRFDDFEEAVKIRKNAEEKYFGEFSYDNSLKISEDIYI